MKMHGAILLLVLLLAPAAHAQLLAQPREWTIDGVQREALVFVPAQATNSNKSSTGSPIVFGFHGHGGTMRFAARSFHFHELWPEGIVVYMQGLPTPSRLVDPEGKRSGWQRMVGDQGDRDLKFFDAVLKSLIKDYRVDERRVFASGHSNGGAFTYLLWAARGDKLAAVAPSAAGGARVLGDLKPKPAMHLAGKRDQLVSFAVQQRCMEHVRRVNRCESDGQSWAKDCTRYPSDAGAPFVAMIHDGDHKYPANGPELIVRFFKEVQPR